MVLPLGIARDLGADHAGSIAVPPPAMNPADGVPIEDFDLEGASAWAIMRADGMGNIVGHRQPRIGRTPTLGQPAGAGNERRRSRA